MEKEFVPYELAVKLKALGFDEPCMYAWCITLEHRIEYDGKMSLKTDGNPFGQFYKGKSFNGKYSPNKNKIQCSAPTFSQAFRWFRDKYGYLSYIDMDNNSFYRYTIYKGKGISEAPLETYEEAELACLDKLIEIVKFKLE